jgi:cysteine/O-acetylserine efflux protein
MANIQAFLIYLIVTTFTPGPNNILSMANAMRYGYRRVHGFLAGVFVGFFLVLLLSAFANLMLVNFIPKAEIWLKILGAVYMIFLAIHIIFTKPAREDSGRKGMNTFMIGFSQQFLNLKSILYGITIYATFIIPSFRQPLILAVFALVLALAGYVSVNLWALTGSWLQNLAWRYQRWINVGMGILLIYSAVVTLI